VTASHDLFLRLLAVAAGAILYGLAFPPHDHAVLAWVALVPLLLVVRGRSTWSAFLCGVAYGFACSATVAGWLAATLARFFELPKVAGVLAGALYGLTFWGTAFGLFAAGAARVMATHRPVSATISIAALWVATELMRGRVMGQPWCLLGYAQHANVSLIQVSAITAVYGVSFLVALGNAAIAEAILLVGARRGGAALRPLLFAAALVVAVWLGGSHVVPGRSETGSLGVALVQTNVPPAVHWTRAYTDRQILEHTRFTDDQVPPYGDGLIVWPENAVPRYLEVEPGLAVLLAGVARRHQADLLFGGPRFEDGRSYNSARLITAAGRNGGAYDKQRLVLLAEANPLHTPAPSAPDENPGEFTSGRGPGVLRNSLALGVSICHEALFPELSATAARAGAELLVNVSNDGWLDPLTGVAGAQHFAMAPFRAVETRRYLVRAATTGISGAFDPYGRVIASLPEGEAGVLRTQVNGRSGLTPYSRVGDVFALGCVLVAAVAVAKRLPRSGRPV
jgi:apolipoprotein N-acyltransferase